MSSSKPLTIVVAINPSASFGRSRDVGPAVVSTLRALGHTVISLTEPSFAELLESGRAAVKNKPDALVVVGGDGMVSLGTNLVATSKVPLGIIPAGTGNDMARGLGIPVGNIEAAIETLIEALGKPPLVIDAALMSHRDSETGEPRETWYACALSAGFDAIVNERANTVRWPKGKNRYLVALGIELTKLRPIQYTLTIDGVEMHTQAVLVAAANNLSYGGGMKIVPDASFTDGLLDLFIVKPLSRLAFLRIFPRVFSGTHVSDPRVTIVRAKRVRIESPNLVGYADGERVGPLPIDIELVPRVLRVLAPMSAAVVAKSATVATKRTAVSRKRQ